MQSIESFLTCTSVIDTETTNLLPESAEIVEIAAAHRSDGTWMTKGMLLGAQRGIPPAASAKNNISQRMIEGRPTFGDIQDEIRALIKWPTQTYWVAHNAAYDRAVLKQSWNQLGYQKDAALCDDDTRWICTWRLSRHILGHSFDDIEYGLNYLRYFLDLPVPDSLRLHRAADDTYLCAVLLERLVAMAIEQGLVDPSLDVGQQLNRISSSPIPIKTWPFGKYRGQPLSDTPNDYYSWALGNVDSLKEGSSAYDPDLAESVRQVLEARLASS